MANYAYINHPKTLALQEFETDLREAVKRILGERWAVELAPWEDAGPVWKVTLPGTAPEADRQLPWICQPGDVGFPVGLQSGRVAFRHAGLGPLDEFARWAQGCVEEELGEHYGVGVFYDASGETYPPETRRYRAGKTFREYLISMWEDFTEADERYLETRYKPVVPEGFW